MAFDSLSYKTFDSLFVFSLLAHVFSSYDFSYAWFMLFRHVWFIYL